MTKEEADARINEGPLTRQAGFELLWLAQKFFQNPVNQAAFEQWQKDHNAKVKVDWGPIRG